MIIGRDSNPFIVRSSIKLKSDYILTHDALFGQQIVVREELPHNYRYLVELITNDKNEGIDSNLFNGKINWTIVTLRLFGSFSHKDLLPPSKSKEPLTLTLVE